MAYTEKGEKKRKRKKGNAFRPCCASSWADSIRYNTKRARTPQPLQNEITTFAHLKTTSEDMSRKNAETENFPSHAFEQVRRALQPKPHNRALKKQTGWHHARAFSTLQPEKDVFQFDLGAFFESVLCRKCMAFLWPRQP